MTYRICLALDLVDDPSLVAEYESAHLLGGVWPEVLEGIRASGVEAMEIWRTGDRLFMIASVAKDWPRRLPPDLQEVSNRWEGAMDRFQKRLCHAETGEKWVRMHQIFSLDQRD